MVLRMRACPGCGIEMSVSDRAYDRKFNASAECWSVYEEVLAAEYQNPAVFGQVHQLTVDTYCVHHAGGRHPDKSVCIHLAGLCLAMEQDAAPSDAVALRRRLARRTSWPHLAPPEERASLTVLDVALDLSPETHVERVRDWAAEVWRVWRPHHEVARELIATSFDTTGKSTRSSSSARQPVGAGAGGSSLGSIEVRGLSRKNWRRR